MSQTYLLIRNTFFNFSSSVWLILLHFFTTPYLVSKLGVEGYAIYSLLYMIIGYFSFLELGLGKAVIKFVSEFHARKDFAAIQRILGTSVIVFCVMGIAGGLLIAVLNETLFLRILQISPAFQATARTVLYMGAIGFLISMPGQVVGAIPRGLQRFDIANTIEVIFGSLQVLFSVLLLYLGLFLREIILLNILISFLSIITYLVVIKKILPKVSLVPRFHSSTFKQIFSFSGYIAVDNILITLSARINSFILGSLRPISAVTYYTIADSLSAKIAFIPRSISHTIFPSFSEIKALEDYEKLGDLYIRATRYMVISTVPFLFLYVIMASKFLFFWLGPDFSQKARLLLQLMGSTYILSFWAYSSMEGARALNKPVFSTRVQLAISILNIGLCFMLIPRMGLLGANLAFSLPRYLLIPYFILFVNRYIFHIPSRQFLSEAFMKPILIAVPCAVLAMAAVRLAHSLIQLLFIFAGVSLLYLSIAFFRILDSVDRRSLCGFIKPRNKELNRNLTNFR